MDATSKSGAPSADRPRRADRSVLLAAKGGGVTFAGAIFSYGSWLVIGLLLARFLGADQYGLYTLASSPVTIAVGLAGLGLSPALVRYVAVYRGRRDDAGIWGTLQVGLGLTSIASIVVGIGLFALAAPIAERLFDEPRLIPLLRLGSLMLPFATLSTQLSAATQGFKRMQYTVIAKDISQSLVRVVLIAGLVLFAGLNAMNATAVQLVSEVIAFGILLYFLHRLFALRRPLRAGRRNLREMVGFSLPIYITRLINTFRGNIQTLLLGAFEAVTTVGVFAVASKVNMVGRMFHDSIVTASAPIVSDLYDQGKSESLARFYQTMTKWTFTANLPLFLIVQLFPGVILSIFGEEYVGGALALTILAWGNLVDAGTGICGVVIDMTGKTSLKVVNAIVTLGLLVGLNLLLIPPWGLVGAAVASAAARAGVNLLRLGQVYVLYRLLPYNVSFLKPVMAGLVALAAGWLMRRWIFTQETLIFAAINVAVLVAVYAAAIVLLGLDQEDRAVLGRIGGRLKAKFRR
jgi:O-antigen/teichoic acid export membrane protein